MQLQNLFVSLLAFGSAIATANPGADHDNIEGRNDAGHVEARSSCPSTMYWSKAHGKCVCSSGYYWAGSSCKSSCGTDKSAYWSTTKKTCVCHNNALKFNSSAKKCDCGPGKTWDSYSKQCVKNCGQGATLKNGRCSCSKSGFEYDTRSNTCSPICKDGSSFINGRCQCLSKPGHTYNTSSKKCVPPVCRDGAVWKNNRCVCLRPGTEYSTSSQKCVSVCRDGSQWKYGRCQCPKTGWSYSTSSRKCTPPACHGGATWQNGRCQCQKGYDYIKSQCVLNCGAEASLKKGSCVCNDDTKIFDKTEKSCSCPDKTEWNKKAGQCVTKCGSQASWDVDRKNCKCFDSGKIWDETTGLCDCTDGKVYKKGACVPDCGETAWWNDNKEKCICHDTGKTYKDKDGCGCYGEDEKYDSKSRACVPDCGDFASYRGGQCKCDTGGLVYNSNGKTCGCKVGDELDDGGKSCKPSCPKNSQYVPAHGEDKATCRCDKDSDEYDSVGRTCKPRCPARSDWENNACRCKNGNHIVREGICQCPEGSIADGNRCKPSCDHGADWSRKDNKCICQGENTKYTKEACVCEDGYTDKSGKCEPNCNFKIAFWEKGECTCRNEHHEYSINNEGEGVCRCPEGFIPDGPNGKYCKTDCGKYATWSKNAKECECNQRNTLFVKNDEPCACKPGYKDKGTGDCRPICTGNTEYVPAAGGNEETCKCDGDDLVYDKGSGRCKPKCLDGATPKPDGTCECKSVSDKYENGCKPKCPPGRTSYVPKKEDDDLSTETCKCKNEKKLWDGKDCVDACPNGAHLENEVCVCRDQRKALKGGSCVDKCPADASYVPPKTDPAKPETCNCKNDNFEYRDGECQCPKDTYPYGKNDQFCRPDCGDAATWNDKECACNKDNAVFNSDKTCSCKKGFVEDDTPSKKCVPKCSGDGVVYDSDKDNCKCLNPHQEYKSGACQCPPNTSGRFCHPDCPTGASLDFSKKPPVCACKVDGAIVVKKEGEPDACKCPAGYREYKGKCIECPGGKVSQDGTTCECTVGKFNAHANKCLCDNGRSPQGGRCQPNCGNVASPVRGGTCKCFTKDASFKEGPPPKCECPADMIEKVIPNSGRVPKKECVCDETKLKGAVMNSDRDGCECPKDYTPVAGECVRDCTAPYEASGANCVCPRTHFEVSPGDCVKRCTDDEQGPGLGKRVSSTDPECYCDEDSGDWKKLNNGKCVRVCDDEANETLDLTKPDRTCVCKPNFGKVNNACVADCPPLTVVVPRSFGLQQRGSGNDQDCYCDLEKTVYDNGHCTPLCEAGDSLSSGCRCGGDSSSLEEHDDHCVERCTIDNQTHDTEANGYKCICDPNSGFASGTPGQSDEKCTPLCGQGKLITADCYCDNANDNSPFEEKDGKCVEKCDKDNYTYDTEDHYKCICDERGGPDSPPKFKKNPDGSCQKVCTNGEDIDGRNGEECYCPSTGADAEFKEITIDQKRYCVKPCENGQQHKADKPEECECPETTPPTYFDDAGTCKELCKEDDPIASKNCYCPPETDSNAVLMPVRGFCVAKCKDEAKHNNENPARCFCPPPNVQDRDRQNRCLPKCSAGVPFKDGLSDCFCDTTGSSQLEKVDNFCSKKCNNQENRAANKFDCDCKTDAFPSGPGNNGPCMCPAGASATGRDACICSDNRKEVVGRECKDKCKHLATSRDRDGNCVCPGGSNVKYQSNKCQCIDGRGGKVYRDGDCRPSCPWDGTRGFTSFDEEKGTCVCLKAPLYRSPDNDKVWDPTLSNGNGACKDKPRAS